jgi:hypothetical protein
MKPPEINDPLDALLREGEPYIADNGFTTRVVAALPRRRLTWLRPAILLGAALTGFVLVAQWLPQTAEIFAMEPADGLVLRFNAESLTGVPALLIALGSLFWGVFAALKWED